MPGCAASLRRVDGWAPSFLGVTPPSDLWAGGASDRPRPRKPRRPGRTHLGLRPPDPPGGDNDPGDDDRWKRLRGPVIAASVATVIALCVGLVAGGVLGDDGNDAVVVGGKAGQRGDAGRVYAAAGPAVVSVRVRQGGQQASGTGFLVDGDGTLVTNSHVVGEADRVTVRFDDSGQRDPGAASAAPTPRPTWPCCAWTAPTSGSRRPLALARSSSVRVGDEVVAIGFPLGLDKTATDGIVSGLERDIQAPNGFQIDRVIQTDAPINPGNSGGPLLDSRGRVVGVNSQIATAGASGNIGIGFAVPADTVRDVLPRLKAGERIERPFIGLTSAADPRGGARVRRRHPRRPRRPGRAERQTAT